VSDPALEPVELASLEGESSEGEPAVVEPATGVGRVVPVALLDELAGNLLWRIGRVSDDSPVTVRVGLASSADLFQTLPRLRSASDAEVEAAINESTLAVEWVGARPKVADR
jgi:hypothetical protein